MNDPRNARRSTPQSGWIFLIAVFLLIIDPPVWAGEPADEGLKELMEQGKDVYGRACVACHQSNGMGIEGNFPPLVDGAPFEAGPAIIGPLEQLGLWQDGTMTLGKDKLKYITYIVINGIPGTRMFAFGPTLSNEEIAAVVTYIRNAWGNDTGDKVTPDMIEALRR